MKLKAAEIQQKETNFVLMLKIPVNICNTSQINETQLCKTTSSVVDYFQLKDNNLLN